MTGSQRGGFMLAAVLVVACGRNDFTVQASSDETGTTDDTVGPTTETTTASTTSATDASDTDSPPPLQCTIDAHCEVGDPCLAGQCVGGTCSWLPRDLDEDGHAPFDCGGADCNDLNPNTFPGAAENCFDGDDNDCNGVSDCFDPVCGRGPSCGCSPSPSGEQCDNGIDDDCDTTVDCNDADCTGTATCGCAAAEVALCVNGQDDDCDGAIDCEDSDCSGEPVCACQAATESCGNGQDDDCDLLIDCADPDCNGLFPCQCSGPALPEQCGNGQDDDCDALLDCADPDCLLSPQCSMCSQEICHDKVDNNCDGKIDCADGSCTFSGECTAKPEQCNNQLDDDKDGLIDCQDPDCANVQICKKKQSNCLTAKLIAGSGSHFGDTTGNPSNAAGSCGGDAGEAVFYVVLNQPSRLIVDSIGTSFDSVLYVRAGSCGGGAEIGCDDDSAGSLWSAKLTFDLLLPGTYYIFLDGFTIDPQQGPNEGPYQLNVQLIENPGEICGDGKDNDGDVYTDCADSDCTGESGCSCNDVAAEPEFGALRCTDGIDNDCDGDVDCDDDDCSASDYYVTECCNGMDENDNGIPDDFNCRCNNSGECSPGQMCYTHTSHTCGFPCTAFFGDVCPFVAAGASCNTATNQCEF